MPHIHEKIDFTVEVFIVYKYKVPLRMHDKFKIWLSVGGHIELDEDPNEAALREVKEEVGLDIILFEKARALGSDDDYKELIAPISLGRHRVNATHEHVTLVYFARALSDKLSDALSAHELAETKWANREDLEKMDLTPNVKFYALKALEELGEK